MGKTVKKEIWLEINGEKIQVERKKIKHMYLRIAPLDGAIKVSLPTRMPLESAENFVRIKWDWIVQTRERMERERAQRGQEEPLSEEEERLRKEAYRQQLKAILPEVIEKCERITGLHALEWRLRDMKTRWGSCNIQKKRIWLNIQLAAYPRECLEYEVIHELVHLLVPGHGKEFWGYMDRFFPEWKRVRAELRGR